MKVTERTGRMATYVWIFGATLVAGVWFRDPSLLTKEAIAGIVQSWGPWAFAGFVAVSLIRGLLLVPSTPVILAGGMLFPDMLPAVFLISIAGIVLSATVLYRMPGLGGYDERLERKYPAKIARVKGHLVKPYAFWLVVGWSFFPLVPTDVICYAAGLVQMSYRRMIFALLLGEIPLVLGYLFFTRHVFSLLG